jgi:UDP-N-acetylglucosamine--N-acetylmuramyl-(pentapeptide) pyrophosphoryl-undecaprenol N-acetylglucosamine transferase
MRVLVAGGGTAGHIEPALNTADALLAMDPATSVLALGTPKGLESELVPSRGYELALVPAVPFPRRPGKELLSLPGRLRRAVRAARGIIDEFQADVVVGFGGYAALPAYLAARGRVPIVVHEANAKAGLANRVGARFTSFRAETHAGSLPGAQRIGLPLRRAIVDLDRAEAGPGARTVFGLDPDRPVLLVFGGSQGARRINEAILGAASSIVAAGASVLHAVGGKNADQRPPAGLPHYVTVDYLDRMDLAYAAADLAVCRAGAMTVAELSAVGLPAVYVPLPIGNGEQRRNAAEVVAAGGGLLVADEDLTEVSAGQLLPGLLADPAHLSRMGECAASQGDPEAAGRLATMVAQAAATKGIR